MYFERIRGEKAENLEIAITCWRKALKVVTLKSFPNAWAGIQTFLGNAYCDRIRGEKASNLESAIVYYREALKVHTLESFPYEWAIKQTLLGNAYCERIKGEKANNLATAIVCYRKALKVFNSETYLNEWSKTQYNLGNAYCDKIRSEKADVRQSTALDIEKISVVLELLCKSSPIDALEYLVAIRFLGIGSQYKKFNSQSDKPKLLSPLVERMYEPINPLLLLTAISVSIIRGEDFHGFLDNYVKGLEIPNFEADLLQINFAHNNDELLQILELEDKYRDALFQLGTKILVKHGSLIGERGLPGDYIIPTMFDLYWACWVVVNPSFQNNPLPVRESEYSSLNGWHRGIDWGFDYNNAIHHVGAHCNYQLNQVNKEINHLLSQEISSDNDRAKFKKLILRQKSSTLLVERAQRFYYWAPHEISAYSAEVAFCIARTMGKFGDISFLDKSYLKYLLPDEILKQLKIKHYLSDKI